MKHVFGRALLVMVVILLAVGGIAPAALASEKLAVSGAANGPVVSNYTNSMTMYVGMKDKLVVTREGVKQSASLYRWTSTNYSIVSVTSSGTITAKKAGTAVIYVTRKSDGSQLSMKVTVKRNKVNNLKPKPSVSAVNYKSIGVRMKSVEVLSASKVAVEYYLICNFPSSWTLTKIKGLQDAINLFNPSTGEFVKTIVGDEYQLWASSISGFSARRGRFVQVIRVIFSGSRVNAGNIKLLNYNINDSTNVQIKYNYRY